MTDNLNRAEFSSDRGVIIKSLPTNKNPEPK